MGFVTAKKNRNCACRKQDIRAKLIAFESYGHAAMYSCRVCGQIAGWKSLDKRDGHHRKIMEEIANANY